MPQQQQQQQQQQVSPLANSAGPQRPTVASPSLGLAPSAKKLDNNNKDATTGSHVSLANSYSSMSQMSPRSKETSNSASPINPHRVGVDNGLVAQTGNTASFSNSNNNNTNSNSSFSPYSANNNNSNNVNFATPAQVAPLVDLQAVLCQPLLVPLTYNVIKRWKDSSGCIVSIEEFSGNFLNGQQMLAGRYLKRIHVELVQGAKIKIENGSLHYMEGRNMVLDAKITGVSMTQGIRPEVSGVGNFWSNSSNHWFVVLDLDHLQNHVVIEHGYFWCCQGTVNIKIKRISLKGSTMGDSNFFHTKLTGSGWVILRIPVPEAGIHRIVLNETKLLTEGHHDVILRAGKEAHYSAEFAGKGLFQKTFNTTNEGILRSYYGSGEVWLMPTIEMFSTALPVYGR